MLRQEPGAITLRQLNDVTNKFLDSDRCDRADRATRPCRETPAIDSAKIGILRRLHHTLLTTARSFHGLRVEEALFQFLDVIPSFRGNMFCQALPPMLLSAFRIIIETRTAERRTGTECVRTCRYRCTPYLNKKN